MNRSWAATAFVISLLAIQACDRKEGVLPKTEDNPQQQAPRADEEKNALSQAERDQYQESARREINQLRVQIDALAERAEISSGDLKAKLEAKIANYREQLQVIEQRWQNLKGAGANVWQGLKNSLQQSIEALRKSVEQDTG
jgi:TolA-binding protein